MGTSYTRIEGYTEIDTPSEENLYCGFELDDEGTIKLEFKDARLAAVIAKLSLNNQFTGLRLDLSYRPAKESGNGGKEETPDSDSGGPTV